MARTYFLYIHLDDYLAQWFIHDHGGKHPVHLTRGSIESGILESFLEMQPDDVPQQIEANNPGAVIVAIPDFKSKDITSYNYLPKYAEDLLVATIRNRFDVELWTSLHKFSSLFKRQDELIYAFMCKHGIEVNEKNWNAIAKRYQRKRRSYRSACRMKKMRKKKKNLPDFKG